MDSHAEWVAATTGKMANGNSGAHRFIGLYLYSDALQVNSHLHVLNFSFMFEGKFLAQFSAIVKHKVWL